MERNDERDALALSAEDRLHAALCALALGELTGDEATALEARIAGEPELAAQYEDVRGTIALVRTSYGDAEALPAAHLERVLAGARGQGGEAPIHSFAEHAAWYRRPTVRLAASLVALAGAGLIGLKLMGSDAASQDAANTRTAKLEELTPDRPVVAPTSDASGPARVEVCIDPNSSVAANGGFHPNFTPPADGAAATFGLHFEGGASEAEARVRDATRKAGERAEELVDGLQAGLSSAGREVSTRAGIEAKDARLQQVTPQVTLGEVEARLKSVTVDAPSDGAFVGYVSKSADLDAATALAALQPVVETLHSRTATATATGGEYRGASDTVPPAAAVPGQAGGGGGGSRSFDTARGESKNPSGPTGGAAGGPSSPGPSGPSSPGPSSPHSRDAVTATTGTPVEYKPTASSEGHLSSPEVQLELARGRTRGVESLGLESRRAQPAGEATGNQQASAKEADKKADRALARDSSDTFFAANGAPEKAPEPGAAAAEPPPAGEGDELLRQVRAYRRDFDVEANPRLTPEQLARLVEDEWVRVHRECQRRPNERPRDMYFRFWGDNAFVPTRDDALSTFAADVDTASYALARRYLREDRLPEKAAIRTEEFVNAFTPDLAPPTEETFALSVELAPTPFGDDSNHWLVRVGVRGKEVAKDQREPLNLTFVVDTSGSMREGNRLELVKHAMRLLVTQLDARDTIAVVAYSNEARQILAPTSAAHRDLIESAIHPLSPNGSTNAEAGLRMGYALAETMLTAGSHNRVVFLSDGVANVGTTDQDRINGDVQRFRAAGIYLNTIGVGMNNHNDVFLEQLANKGDGICDYIDDAKAAEHAIVERFTGAFVPIASDVKLQVEFDPAQVLRWRQLGYENRAIADKDFRNDKVDAGEVGAGHQVTCLYEVELASELGQLDTERALATLRVRWKAPKAARQDANEVDVFEREATLGYGQAAGAFRAASVGFRGSALAAEFAEFLRRSSHAREDSYTALVAELGALIDSSPMPGRATNPLRDELVELADLVRRADGLGLAQRTPVSDLERTLDEYRRYQYLRATIDGLRSAEDPLLRQIEETNRSLEQQIRDALRRDLQRRNG